MIIKAIASLCVFLGVAYVTRNLLLAILCIDLVAVMILVFFDIPKTKKYSRKLVFEKENIIQGIKKMLIVMFPIFLIGLCYNVVLSFPRIIFEKVFSTEELGFFSSISTITVVIVAAANSILVPIMPKFSILYNEKKTKELLKMFMLCNLIVFVVGIVSVCGSWLLGSWALEFLFGEGIKPYVYLLIPVVICSIITTLMTCYTNFFISIGKNVYLLVINIVGTIACLSLSYFFVKTYYLNGITYAMIFSQILIVLFLLIKVIILFVHMIKSGGEKNEVDSE